MKLLFKDLSKKAKDKAVKDYIEGWQETHDVSDLEEKDIYKILENNDEMRYSKSGKYSGEG